MNFEGILLFGVITLMCWFCFSLFYMVNFLRRSGATYLNFFSTIFSSLTGNIGNFYHFFTESHSKFHDRKTSKFIAYSNILSFLCMFLAPFTYAIIEAIFV